MTLSTGTILNNRYRIAKLVGQGGFGAVYRAWDTSLNRPVAVKENFDTGPQSQRQFEREAQLLAALRHPNLPVVGDYFILPGQGQYLVMDFVEGRSLDTLLNERGGPLDEAEVLPWIRQVCDALDYLHTQTPPIIHRDIKPENIIITDKGRAMLVDFGISKVYDPNKGTTVGAKAVTPGYSPPEQYGRGRTDARSDVYALGATLYTLLTGQVPPEGPDLSSGADILTPPREVNPAVSATTSAAIVAAMAPTISQRLASAAGLVQRLTRDPASPPIPSTLTTTTPSAVSKSQGPAIRLWTVAAAVAAVVALFIWAFWAFRAFDDANKTKETNATLPATEVVLGSLNATPEATETLRPSPELSPTETLPPPALPTTRPTAALILTATRTPEPRVTPTPAIAGRILWTDGCDPRTDLNYCQHSSLEALEDFYNVLADLNLELDYHDVFSLTSDSLTDYNIIIADYCFPGDMSHKLADYVAQGGSIIVIANNACGSGDVYAAGIADSFTRDYGIRYSSEDLANENHVQAVPVTRHPISEGIEHLYQFRYTELDVQDQAMTVFNLESHPIVAVYDGDEGTIIALTSNLQWGPSPSSHAEWATTNPEYPDTYQNFVTIDQQLSQSDNFIFWRNMLTWLLEKSQEKRVMGG